MRRDRVLPGPLKTLPRRRRASLPASFAIVIGAIAATSAVVAAISGRDAVSSTMTSPATSSGETAAASAASSAVADLTPRKVATREPAPAVMPPAAPAPVSPETVTTGSRHDDTAPARKVAAARPVAVPTPEASSSPFRLDQLPVLAEDGSAFEPDYGSFEAATAPSVRKAARAPARRAPTQQQRDPAAEVLRLPQP